MADFNLLRFQDCSETLVEKLSRNTRWIVFWLAAVFLLFLNLGMDSISGSEGRWLAVANEMIRSGDYLHPTINGASYFDKPLVSYWLIAAASFLSGGLNEFSARLPSALAALLALFSAVSLAKRLFGEKASLLTGWIFLTVYSFVFWGRLAEADMENLAFIMAAAAWYARCRETRTVFGYSLFWILCAVGAQTKGLAAFAVPSLVAGIDMLLSGTLKKHLNWKSLLGFAVGMAVYSIPFVLEAVSRKSYDASGIVLVFRENILRAVNPWDHKDEPCWVYFGHTARLFLPWTPFLVLAVIASARRILRNWKGTGEGEKWIFFSILAIFALFSASQSRRVYYILPIVPFCAVLCGAFLADSAAKLSLERRIASILIRIVDWAIPVAGVLALSAPFVFLTVAPGLFAPDSEIPVSFAGIFYFLIPGAGVSFLIFWIVSQIRARQGRGFGFSQEDPALDRVIPVVYAGLFLAFALILPPLDASPDFRSGKAFFKSVPKILFVENAVPEENVAFYEKDLSNGVFYMNLPKNAAMFGPKKRSAETRTFIDDTAASGGIEEFAAFLKKIETEGGAVLGRFDSFENPALPAEIRLLFVTGPLTPAPGVLVEPDTLTDAKARVDAEEALFLGADPQKDKKIRAFRKIIRKKMLLRVFPPVKKSE